jgi:hypothetical protein
MTERPLCLHRDERNRLHFETGPAIAWGDGFGIYAWHGTRVPRQVIEAPESLTAEQITAEQNVEVRRVMIERIGAERYLELAGAKMVSRDDWGTLWRAERPGDSPYLAVELLNSTPEPDGSTHRYFIRVPGTADQPARRCLVCKVDIAKVPTTPLEALGWGYHVCAAHYQPAVQS